MRATRHAAPRCCATGTSAELTAAEREHLRRLLALLRPEPPTRPSRRRRPRPARCAPTPARTLRAALRNQRRAARAAPPRPLPAAAQGGAADRRVRLDGALRRRAAALRARRRAPRTARRSRRSPSAPGSPGSPASCGMRDAERALAAAGRAIPDWSGGTRLGEVLRGVRRPVGAARGGPAGRRRGVLRRLGARRHRAARHRRCSGCAGSPTSSSG